MRRLNQYVTLTQRLDDLSSDEFTYYRAMSQHKVQDKAENTSKANSSSSGGSSASSASSRKQGRREKELYEGPVGGTGRGTIVRIEQLPAACMRDACTTGSNTVSSNFMYLNIRTACS